MADTIFGVDAATLIAFDKAYRASRDPEVSALHVGEVSARNPDGSPEVPLQQPDRYFKAVELARAGHVVDVSIDGWGQDPYFTMMQRVMLGIPNVLSAYQNVPIKSSVDLADYPPFAPPSPPPQQSADLVGPLLDANTGTYAASMLAQQLAKDGALVNGTPTTHNGISLVFKQVNGTMLGMGSTYLWVKA